jgi:hypothetical protein
VAKRTCVSERLEAKTQTTDTGCIVWTGYCDPDGYGRINIIDRPAALAHRVAWVEAHGPIPPETPCVLHRCDNPPCCNIDHLFLGTQEDNMVDKVTKGRGSTNGNDRKTHCPQGHPYDGANTYTDAHGKRYCRTCQRIRARERRLA